jgi:dolichyl-phosphate-mannose--protein O-mannosyl transferase
MRETLLLGNPAVWWSGVLAVLICAVLWIKRRRWEYSVPVVGVLATWAPWLPVTDRPIFAFYAVSTLPFIAIALALVLHAAVERARTPRRRYLAWLMVGLLVTATVACAAYFWPIWTHQLISWDAWDARMWFKNWV